MKTVYLLRHGQTEDNKNRIVQGQGDSPLTPEGILSIKNRAIKLKDVNFDAIYCSPLGRTRSSMEIFLKEIGRNIEVVYLDELMEIDFGEYTKKKINEIKDVIYEHKTNRSKPYPGGESGDLFKKRVMRFVDEFILKNEFKCFFVMTHYGVIETILNNYNKMPDEDIRLNKDAIIRLSFPHSGFNSP